MLPSWFTKGEVRVLMVNFEKNLEKIDIEVILCSLCWAMFLDDSNLHETPLLFEVNPSVSGGAETVTCFFCLGTQSEALCEPRRQ